MGVAWGDIRLIFTVRLDTVQSVEKTLSLIVKFMSPFKSSIFLCYGFSRPSKCGFGYVYVVARR